MVTLTISSCLGLVVGALAIVSNPSPIYGAMGLVVMAWSGGVILSLHGGFVLSIILILIYFGAVLVVFAFVMSMSSDRHPKSWTNRLVAFHLVLYVICITLITMIFWRSWSDMHRNPAEWLNDPQSRESAAIALLFSAGVKLLLIAALALTLTLLVVFNLVWGLHQLSLRPINK